MKFRANPMNVSEHLWYYEEKKGITIVYEIYDRKTGGYIRTDQFMIPWKKLLESVNRKYEVSRKNVKIAKSKNKKIKTA